MRLRPYKESDSKYLLKWFSDERGFYMWSAGFYTYPLTEEQLLGHKKKFDEDENAWIFVALDDEGTPIGHIAMRSADYKENNMHLCFIIVDPEQRGKGYGKEIVNLATKYIFEILKMNSVTLKVYAVNPIAKKCYESVGFKEVNCEMASFEYKNEKWDCYLMKRIK